MSKKIKILSVLLACSVLVCAFSGCKKEIVKGSSAVSTETESEVSSIIETSSEKEKDETSSKKEDKEDKKDKEESQPSSSSKKEEESSSSNNKTSSTASKKPATNSKKEIVVNKTGFPIVEDKITFRIAGIETEESLNYEEMSMFKYYEPLTNIEIEFDEYTRDTAMEIKKLSLQSGDLPDMYVLPSNCYSSEEMKKYFYNKKPSFVDILPFIEEGYAPTIKGIIDNNKTLIGLNKSPNGKMFFLPEYPNTTPKYAHWLNINKKWLDNITGVTFRNGQYPTDTDEFVKMLRAFKEQDANKNGDPNDEIPFSVWFISYTYVFSMFGMQVVGGGVSIDNNKKVYYPAYTELAKIATTYWQNIFKEGLADKSTINQYSNNYAVFRRFITEGNCGCFIFRDLQGVASAGHLDDYITIPMPTANPTLSGYNLPKAINPAPENMSIRGGTTFTKACESVPALLRYIDYLRSDDGIMLCNYGDPNGGLYVKNTDGSYTLTEKGKTVGAGVEGLGTAMGGGAVKYLSKPLNKVSTQRLTKFQKYTQEAINVYEKAHKENPYYMLPSYLKTASEIANLEKLNGFSNPNPWIDGFVRSGKEINSANWDSTVTKGKQNGIGKYIAIYQNIVDRNKDYLPTSDNINLTVK